MKKLRKKFTKWYVKKGYTFGYDDFSPSSAVWNCPWYVKPLLFLFSPSIYDVECITNYIYKGFMDGLQSNIENEFYKIAFKEAEQNNDKL